MAIDHRGEELVKMSMHLSTGAIIGIASCILTVALTSIYISKKGYVKGSILHLFVGLLFQLPSFSKTHLNLEAFVT